MNEKETLKKATSLKLLSKNKMGHRMENYSLESIEIKATGTGRQSPFV